MITRTREKKAPSTEAGGQLLLQRQLAPCTHRELGKKALHLGGHTVSLTRIFKQVQPESPSAIVFGETPDSEGHGPSKIKRLENVCLRIC